MVEFHTDSVNNREAYGVSIFVIDIARFMPLECVRTLGLKDLMESLRNLSQVRQQSPTRRLAVQCIVSASGNHR